MFDWGWRILFLLIWGAAFQINGPIYNETGFSLFLINSFGVGGAALIKALIMTIALVPLILKYSGSNKIKKNDEEEKNKNNKYTNIKKINEPLKKILSSENKEINNINKKDLSLSNHQESENNFKNMEFDTDLEKLNFVFLDSKKDKLSPVFNNIKETQSDLQFDDEWDETQNDIKNGKCVVINKYFKVNMVMYDSLPFYHVFARGNNITKIDGLKKIFSTDFAFESLSKAFLYLIEKEIKEDDEKSFLETEKVFVLNRNTDLEIYSKDYIERKRIEDEKRIKDEKKEIERQKIEAKKTLQKQKVEDDKLLRKKLLEVKKLYDDGLITEEVLKKKQEEILGLKS